MFTVFATAFIVLIGSALIPPGFEGEGTRLANVRSHDIDPFRKNEIMKYMLINIAVAPHCWRLLHRDGDVCEVVDMHLLPSLRDQPITA